jgi:archaemetzincin
MNQPCITLVSFGIIEREVLDRAAVSIRHEYSHCTSFREMHLDLNVYFDPSRRQYNGNALLQVVEGLSTPDSVKTIGLFTVDLFIPILTYIFGQACLGGKSGIVSRYRLSNEHYGLPPDNRSLQNRIIKELNHELGHCFGLVHCHNIGCVMRSSTYVEDIDLKEEHLCPDCKGFL